MSCFELASAEVFSGVTGPILVIKVTAFSGFVPAVLEEGKPPFNPDDVLPVIIRNSLPEGLPRILELNKNIEREDEFTSIVIFCDDQKKGTKISITKR